MIVTPLNHRYYDHYGQIYALRLNTKHFEYLKIGLKMVYYSSLWKTVQLDRLSNTSEQNVDILNLKKKLQLGLTKQKCS